MVGNFTVETFRPHLGERFRLDSEPAMDVELIEAEGVGERPFEASGRVPFSLVFRGPLEPVLPQRIYRFDSTRLPKKFGRRSTGRGSKSCASTFVDSSSGPWPTSSCSRGRAPGGSRPG